MKFVLLVIVTLWCFEFGISLPHDPEHLEESDDDCSNLCSDNFEPVCGSTGRTYPNECHFDCAAKRRKNLTKVDDGPCPKELSHHSTGKTHCHCQKSVEPVCGTNGVTYRNLCLLKCAHQKDRRIKLRSRTSCDDAERSSSEDKKPVGFSRSLRNTTPSESTTTATASVDDDECVCPRIYTPVCGTNGVKYSNMCELRCVMAKNSTVTLAYKGRCKEKVVEKHSRANNNQKVLPINANGECVCEGDIPAKQVCGSNGVIYQNECEFNCAEYKEPTLYMVNEGICRVRSNTESEEVEVRNNPPEACKCASGDLPASDNEPVCSGDNVTYMSKCALLCEKKKYPSVRLSFCGPCNKTHRCKRGGGKKSKSRKTEED